MTAAERWEKDNLCGICPYRKAVQTENDRLREENERLKAGLRRIADANSGGWGWIAHDTLHPDRARTEGS